MRLRLFASRIVSKYLGLVHLTERLFKRERHSRPFISLDLHRALMAARNAGLITRFTGYGDYYFVKGHDGWELSSHAVEMASVYKTWDRKTGKADFSRFYSTALAEFDKSGLSNANTSTAVIAVNKLIEDLSRRPPINTFPRPSIRGALEHFLGMTYIRYYAKYKKPLKL